MHGVHPPCAYLAQDLDLRITRISFFSLIGGSIFLSFSIANHSNVTKKIYLTRVQHSYKT
jgi:hypothetical protein